MADMIVGSRAVSIGQYVTFTCKHPTDQQTYGGKIVGLVDYDTAKQHEPDLIPYYREVAKIVTDMAPYNKLVYMILEYYQTNDRDLAPLRVIRALDWIDAETLTIIDPDAYIDVRVYNKTVDDSSDVTTLLRSHGYTVRLMSA